MKIIVRGELPNSKPVRLECDHCKTVVECERHEMHLIPDQRDGDYFMVNCPVCTRAITKAARG